jgi:hypothetical protein
VRRGGGACRFAFASAAARKNFADDTHLHSLRKFLQAVGASSTNRSTTMSPMLVSISTDMAGVPRARARRELRRQSYLTSPETRRREAVLRNRRAPSLSCVL